MTFLARFTLPGTYLNLFVLTCTAVIGQIRPLEISFVRHGLGPKQFVMIMIEQILHICRHGLEKSQMVYGHIHFHALPFISLPQTAHENVN